MATHGTKYAWNTKTQELVDAEDVARIGNKEPPGTYVCTHDGQHAMHFVLTQSDRYRIDGYFAHTKSCGHGAGGGVAVAARVRNTPGASTCSGNG